MLEDQFDRRTILAGTAAFGASALLSGRASAQAKAPSAGAGAALPPRGEFVVRGAYVLSMDDRVGDFASGDVHVNSEPPITARRCSEGR